MAKNIYDAERGRATSPEPRQNVEPAVEKSIDHRSDVESREGPPRILERVAAGIQALESLEFPEWLPPAVVDKARQVERELDRSNPVEVSLFVRLITNPKMEGVWRELRIARSKDAASSPSQKAPEVVAGVFFGLVFAHARNAIIPADAERREQLVQSRVVDLAQGLEGRGELHATILEFGCAATAEAAFVRSIAPVMDSLFGSSHWEVIATFAEIVFERRFTRDQVKGLAGWKRKRGKSES